MRKLTDRQQRFVDEYLIDLNAAQAAIRAGYSARTASRIGPELLGKTCVAAALSEAKAIRSEKTGIDSMYVLNRLVAIDQMDVLDILTDDGNLKPLREWPQVWRTTLSGIDLQRVREYEKDSGADKAIETVLQKIKWPDKVKNLENIGRHVEVQAWKDRIELEDKTDYAKLLETRASATERLRNSTDA